MLWHSQDSATSRRLIQPFPSSTANCHLQKNLNPLAIQTQCCDCRASTEPGETWPPHPLAYRLLGEAGHGCPFGSSQRNQHLLSARSPWGDDHRHERNASPRGSNPQLLVLWPAAARFSLAAGAARCCPCSPLKGCSKSSPNSGSAAATKPSKAGGPVLQTHGQKKAAPKPASG